MIAKLLGLYGQAFTFRIVTGQHTRLYQQQISKEIDTFFRKQDYQVRDVEAGHSSLQTASENLAVLINFLLIMALLTALVGSIGLTGTMSMNVMERTREIGVMRSIGAGDREVMKSVIVEGVLIGLISWCAGAALAFPISKLLSTIIGLAIFHTPLGLVFSWQGFIIWLFLVLILSTLASILPARSAARLTIREVLAYE